MNWLMFLYIFSLKPLKVDVDKGIVQAIGKLLSIKDEKHSVGLHFFVC